MQTTRTRLPAGPSPWPIAAAGDVDPADSADPVDAAAINADSPMTVVSPSPWSAPSVQRSHGPLSANSYWRTAFAAEMTDSAIHQALVGATRLAHAPVRRRRLRLPPGVYNAMGRFGLWPLAWLANRALALFDQRAGP